jgi:hypothetical protein
VKLPDRSRAVQRRCGAIRVAAIWRKRWVRVEPPSRVPTVILCFVATYYAVTSPV